MKLNENDQSNFSNLSDHCSSENHDNVKLRDERLGFLGLGLSLKESEKS